jgi:hypothetical protein
VALKRFAGSQERRRDLIAKLLGWRGVGFVMSWTLLVALLMRLTAMQVCHHGILAA